MSQTTIIYADNDKDIIEMISDQFKEIQESASTELVSTPEFLGCYVNAEKEFIGWTIWDEKKDELNKAGDSTTSDLTELSEWLIGKLPEEEDKIELIIDLRINSTDAEDKYSALDFLKDILTKNSRLMRK